MRPPALRASEPVVLLCSQFTCSSSSQQASAERTAAHPSSLCPVTLPSGADGRVTLSVTHSHPLCSVSLFCQVRQLKLIQLYKILLFFFLFYDHHSSIFITLWKVPSSSVITACPGKMTLLLQKCYRRAVLLLSMFSFIIQAGCFSALRDKKIEFVCSPQTRGHFRHSAPPSSIHAVWRLLFCAQVWYLMIYVSLIPQAHFWGVPSPYCTHRVH